MKIRVSVRIAAIALTAATAIALTGCGGSGPSQAACKAAMKQQYATALETGKTQTEPAACKGLPASVLNKLATEVLSGN